MIFLALSAVLFCQENFFETKFRLLSDKDPAVREAATVELMKTPFDKLDRLEPRLADADADLAARIRRVMRSVLGANLRSAKPRFEMRTIADETITADWVAAGADPTQPPKGFEARQFHDKAQKSGKSDWILVESAFVTEDDIAQAEIEADSEPGRRGYIEWLVRFELKPAGAERFDKAAAELFRRVPKGKIAMVLDERIRVAPSVNAERFSGKAVISGGFSEEEAKGVARLLKGEGRELRAEKDKESASPEKTIEFLRKFTGLGKATIQADAGGLRIGGPFDTSEIDLVALWQSLRVQGYRLVPAK